MSPVIRGVTPDDFSQLISLEAEFFGSDAWSPEVFEEELRHPSSHYLVLEDAGHVIGYGGLRSGQPGGPGDIQTLAVHPDYRGQGWGRSLLEALLDIAKGRGVPEVFLEVRADNEAARGLYHQAGFREIDRRAGYYQPDGVDAVVMRRPQPAEPGGKVR